MRTSWLLSWVEPLVHWRAKTYTDPRRVLPSCAEWSGPMSLALHMSLWDSGTFYPRVRGETGCHVYSLLVSLCGGLDSGGACGACGVWVCFRSYFRASIANGVWGGGGGRFHISHM